MNHCSICKAEIKDEKMSSGKPVHIFVSGGEVSQFCGNCAPKVVVLIENLK